MTEIALMLNDGSRDLIYYSFIFRLLRIIVLLTDAIDLWLLLEKEVGGTSPAEFGPLTISLFSVFFSCVCSCDLNIYLLMIKEESD